MIVRWTLILRSFTCLFVRLLGHSFFSDGSFVHLFLCVFVRLFYHSFFSDGSFVRLFISV